VNYWVSGQLAQALRFVSLMQSGLFQPRGLMPEFAFYDCFSCHHSLDSPRWTPARAGPGVMPGTLRVQKQHFIVLQALAEALDSPAAANELATASAALTEASQRDVAEARAAATKLSEWLRGHQSWAQQKFSRAETAALRKTLLRYAASDKASDFLTAEQVVMGVESLSYGLGDIKQRQAALDSLYGTVKSNASFNPERFAETCRSLQGQF
jgi:hypothetical protein